ncbi:hypothetical protein HQ520_04095 [bacterium]|nr:hypothetical protein [bacterium]
MATRGTFGRVRGSEDIQHPPDLSGNHSLETFHLAGDIFEGEELVKVVVTALVNVDGVDVSHAYGLQVESRQLENVRLESDISEMLRLDFGGGADTDQMPATCPPAPENVRLSDQVVELEGRSQEHLRIALRKESSCLTDCRLEPLLMVNP